MENHHDNRTVALVGVWDGAGHRRDVHTHLRKSMVWHGCYFSGRLGVAFAHFLVLASHDLADFIGDIAGGLVSIYQTRAIDRTKAGLGGSAIIGETGMIIVAPYITDNTVQAGKVRFSTPKLGSDEWFCRTEDEMLEVGERVVVTDIIGNELLVTRAKRLNTVKVEQHSIQN